MKIDLKLKKYSSGFTLIELVIVMAMIGIVSSASFKLIRFSDTSRSLSIAAAELKGAVRTAQTLALAPPTIDDGSGNGTLRTVCGFGVKNDAGTNKLEIVYAYSVGGEVKDCRSISDFATACGGNNACLSYETKLFEGFTLNQEGNDIGIFFRSPYGKVFGAGDVTIKQDNSTHFKSIKINEYGKISAE